MCKSFKSSIVGLLCATIAAGDLPSEALAGPMNMTDPATLGPSSPAETIHYRRHWGHRHYYPRHRRYRHHRRYRYGYDPAGAIFAGAALGIMAAGIAAASRPRYYGWYPYYGYGWGYPRWGWGW